MGGDNPFFDNLVQIQKKIEVNPGNKYLIDSDILISDFPPNS